MLKMNLNLHLLFHREKKMKSNKVKNLVKEVKTLNVSELNEVLKRLKEGDAPYIGDRGEEVIYDNNNGIDVFKINDFSQYEFYSKGTKWENMDTTKFYSYKKDGWKMYLIRNSNASIGAYKSIFIMRRVVEGKFNVNWVFDRYGTRISFDYITTELGIPEEVFNDDMNSNME